MIRIVQGDLLKDSVDAIVNTVNCVGIMGKGIALQFKKKWPENFKAYNTACRNGVVKPGRIFVYDRGESSSQPRYLINFPTKNHWREKSKLSYITDGLLDLVAFMRINNVRSIAIPPLGCGNGGLEWNDVRPLIENAFLLLNDIDVHLFEPGNVPSAKSMIVNTVRPTLSIGRAVVIKLISLYREMDYLLSKLEVQKLCYFAQEAGALSKLRFEKNQFGPYAYNLRHVLNDMDGHYISGVGDHDLSESEISLVVGADKQADDCLLQNVDIQDKLEKISSLIDGYETPYGMELLATVHWAAKYNAIDHDAETVIKAVHNWEPTKPEWNQRKKALMENTHIMSALERIKQQDWL